MPRQLPLSVRFQGYVGLWLILDESWSFCLAFTSTLVHWHISEKVYKAANKIFAKKTALTQWEAASWYCLYYGRH